jgi:hypothetical protein
MLENSLYRKFERDLDQIALPEPDLWFPAEGKRLGRAPRTVLAAIAVTTLVIGLIFASQRFTGQPKSEVATEPQREALSPSAKYPIHIPGSISAAGPAALDTCQLIAHAAFDLGFGSSRPTYPVFRTVPEGVVFEHADGPWGSHPCAFGYDAGWASPHLLVRPVATTQAEVGALLRETFANDRTVWAWNPIWTPDGPNTWIAGGAANPWSAPWVAVAVSAEPYLLVVTGPNEETARKLMQGVLDQLRTP